MHSNNIWTWSWIKFWAWSSTWVHQVLDQVLKMVLDLVLDLVLVVNQDKAWIFSTPWESGNLGVPKTPKEKREEENYKSENPSCPKCLQG